MRILFILLESTMLDRLGVMYLSAALKERNHEVDLKIVELVGKAGLRAHMQAFQPDIVGYSMMTGEHLQVLAVNRELKREFSFLAVFGGPHATFFPDVIEEEGCDAVCVGEGDAAFPEFCQRIETGDTYWQTPNFIVKKDGQLHRNAPRPLITNLDSLPFPDRTLMYDADPALAAEGRKTFFATRGCPYQCTYCFNHKYNELYRGKGPVLRYRSPESFVEEIVRVRERFVLEYVVIGDDTFMLRPHGWFEHFCGLYRDRVGLPFGCAGRANLITDELIGTLKKAGLDVVGMGTECGDETTANQVLKRNLTNEEILDAAAIVKKHGVKLLTFSMMGMPVPDSFAVDLKTLDLNIQIAPTFALASLLNPYPSTAIAEYVRAHGFLDDDSPIPETNKRASMLTFGSRLEKRRVENLHKLFGIIVSFPFLRPFCILLCSLPRNVLYRSLYYIWYGYSFKMKLWPIRSPSRELGNYFRVFRNQLRKT